MFNECLWKKGNYKILYFRSRNNVTSTKKHMNSNYCHIVRRCSFNQRDLFNLSSTPGYHKKIEQKFFALFQKMAGLIHVLGYKEQIQWRVGFPAINAVHLGMGVLVYRISTSGSWTLTSRISLQYILHISVQAVVYGDGPRKNPFWNQGPTHWRRAEQISAELKQAHESWEDRR